MLSGENIWYRPQVRAEDRAIANKNMREQQQKDKRKQFQQQQQRGPHSHGRPEQQHQVAAISTSTIATLFLLLSYTISTQQSFSRYRSAEEERAEAAHSALRHPLGDHFTFLHIFQEWERCAFSNSWCEQNFINHRSMKTVKQIR